MGANVSRALKDRFLQGTSRTRVIVLCRERGLGLGGFADCLGEIAALRSTTVKDAGLVEVEMRFDESGGNQPAGEVDRFALALDPPSARPAPPPRHPHFPSLPSPTSPVLAAATPT